MTAKQTLLSLGLTVLPVMIAIGLMCFAFFNPNTQFILVRTDGGQGEGTVRLALALLTSCTYLPNLGQNCTHRMGSLSPVYNLSAIPPSLSPALEPPAGSPATAVVVAFVFGAIFVVLLTVYIGGHNPRFYRLFWITLGLGLIGFTINLITSLVLFERYLGAVKDFNSRSSNSTGLKGHDNKLVAERTGAFGWIWAGCALWFVSFIVLFLWRGGDPEPQATTAEEPYSKEVDYTTGYMGGNGNPYPPHGYAPSYHPSYYGQYYR